jgi:hypothetical protein
VGVQGEAACERSPWAAADAKKGRLRTVNRPPEKPILPSHWKSGARFVIYRRQDLLLTLGIEANEAGAGNGKIETNQKPDTKKVKQGDGSEAYEKDHCIHQRRPYAIAPDTLKSLA